MKYLILFLFSLSTSATGLDSIAFFYKDHKVVVLINDYEKDGRLTEFMNHLNAPNHISIKQDHFKMSCHRSYNGAGCRFTFYPAANIEIANRTLDATINLDQSLGEFEMEFASSMKDKFQLRLSAEGEIRMQGSKILN